MIQNAVVYFASASKRKTVGSEQGNLCELQYSSKQVFVINLVQEFPKKMNIFLQFFVKVIFTIKIDGFIKSLLEIQQNPKKICKMFSQFD